MAGLIAIGVNYGRLADKNEQRRVQLMFAGMAVAIIPTLPIPIAEYLPVPSLFRAAILSAPYSIMRAALVLMSPISVAYTILRHRLFDIRVLIRRGIQYALARRVMVSIIPAVGVLLILDLIGHGDRPLISILSARGWLYVGLGGLALIARSRRHWILRQACPESHALQTAQDEGNLLDETSALPNAPGNYAGRYLWSDAPRRNTALSKNNASALTVNRRTRVGYNGSHSPGQ